MYRQLCYSNFGRDVSKKYLHKVGYQSLINQEILFKSVQPFLTIITGIFLGVLVTLTSIGAGALGAVFLAYLYPIRLTPSKLIATDIVNAIPLAICAGPWHLLIGSLDFILLGNLWLGSISAVFPGAILSSKLPQDFIRLILCVILMIVGIKLLWSLA